MARRKRPNKYCSLLRFAFSLSSDNCVYSALIIFCGNFPFLQLCHESDLKNKEEETDIISLPLSGGRNQDAEGKCVRLHVPFKIILLLILLYLSFSKWPVVVKGKKEQCEVSDMLISCLRDHISALFFKEGLSEYKHVHHLLDVVRTEERAIFNQTHIRLYDFIFFFLFS